VKALIQENVSLAPLTTFRIGGPARYFIEVLTEEALQDAVHFAKEKQLPLFVLGDGSNLLVSDSGFAGLVVKAGIRGVEWDTDRDKTVIHAGAGEEWDQVVAVCVERELSGIECLSGIPGSVGGTPVQNVGAYGQEVSDVLVTVRAYDRQNDQIVNLSRDQCRFAYRTSLFNTTARERYIILRVTCALTKGGAPSIRYPDLQREFENEPETARTLSAVRAAVRRIRARKAMLLVEGDPDCRSAGSFFKNPIITEQQFEGLQTRLGGNVPRYPGPQGKVKTAAACLIERVGFHKGYSLGPVGLSTRHTLALVNRGGAKAEDVLRLARKIQSRVLDRCGVELVPEPVFVGFGGRIAPRL
jgi:UDP-N-acetylmuramate dehydrogenase